MKELKKFQLPGQQTDINRQTDRHVFRQRIRELIEYITNAEVMTYIFAIYGEVVR